jgi:hypothetical protein
MLSGGLHFADGLQNLLGCDGRHGCSELRFKRCKTRSRIIANIEQQYEEEQVMETNVTLKVGIKPLANGNEALNLSIAYGDRNAEAMILLKPGDKRTKDDRFVRNEIAQLGAALQALAKAPAQQVASRQAQ